MNGKRKKFGRRLGYGLRIVLVGMLTGTFAGVVVTLYNLLTSLAEEFSRGYYGFFRDNPAFIPLLFAALALGAVVIGGTLRFLPMIRGSGIPQAEGALRGLLRFKWYRELTGMFAASLFTVFLGLAAGAEGPSVLIGASCGYGTSDLLRQGALVRRYQITGGASAGLAAAFNAPLTGMAFAFEEGQKRFTPRGVRLRLFVRRVRGRRARFAARGAGVGHGRLSHDLPLPRRGAALARLLRVCADCVARVRAGGGSGSIF